ncbi:MAG: hypothetical protein H6526_09025 [Actinobacteria bacterium]|nr:hypothetical protein [Actinomycetota bacterium]
MSLSRNMKQGDLEPDFDPVLYDPGGQPYDLSTATSVKVTCYQAGASVFTSRTASGNSSGQVNMPWVSGDTDDQGEMLLEVEVEWSSGRIQTFPDNGYFIVNVTPDLT